MVDQRHSFSEAVGLMTAAGESDGKNCSGCKHLGYDSGGHPECIRNYELVCFKTDYLMRDPEGGGDREV